MDEGQSKEVQDWVARSDYDVKTADAMFQTGRYLYVFFCCQQAVEKRYKARILANGQIFPRIHDLVRLSELAGVPVSGDMERLGPECCPEW